ncbi:MAG: hypothetical protein K0R87_2094 [Pseudonocardia sp.]|nr:hypothetical protein [Pseudonocardia sp.]
MGAGELVVGAVLVVACVVALCLVVRRVRLVRGGGVDVSLRRRLRVASGSGWHSGVGRYRGDELAWFRLTSLWPGPTVVVDRTDLEIVERRTPSPAEVESIPPAGVVLRCRTPARTLELAMSPGVLTGFLAWLEATPPGRTGYRQAS